jgi:hypothetical protein
MNWSDSTFTDIFSHLNYYLLCSDQMKIKGFHTIKSAYVYIILNGMFNMKILTHKQLFGVVTTHGRYFIGKRSQIRVD